MNVVIRAYTDNDIVEMIEIWNAVIEEGIAFPQEEFLDEEMGKIFFQQQTITAVAVDEENHIQGLYILHPNNVGRCGHIGNASYAVSSQARGLRIGEKLVRDSLEQAAIHGFSIIQYNAVVKTNIYARRLYEKLGFVLLGIIPKGFRMKDGRKEDICVYYYEL